MTVALRRTLIEREADDLDLEMHRLVNRLERFANMVRPSLETDMIRGSAAALSNGRHTVRAFMHPKDVRDTEPSP